MKKYCPFCDSELPETLWCEQCKRYVVLYNTHDDAVSAASAPVSKPASPAVPEDPGKNTGKDIPKIILLCSMLAVCLVLCLVVCAHLVLKRGTEPSGTARAPKNDIQDNTKNSHDTERASATDEETAKTDPPEASVSDEPSTQPADETPVQPAGEPTSEPSAAEAGWKQLEQLDPLDLQVYGDTKYYYYAAEDIEALGLQCTYYHLGIAYDEAADAVKSFFGDAASEEEPYDNTYFNSYVDSGHEYYTSFQQILSYDCGDFRCSVNYDTGSGVVHFIGISGENIEDCAELIREISALASPEYALSPEDLVENILSTEDILLHLDPPDMWHEEYVYQDSRISLSMTYSDGIYELQVTSREYADDTEQSTLSISRPK